MSLKEQLDTLKRHWLIIVILVIVFAVFNLGGLVSEVGFAEYDMVEESAYATRSMGMPAPMYPSEDFAPEVEERKITKTASLNTEVEKETFNDNVNYLKSIVTSTDSFLLNENIKKQGKGKTSYYTGYFQLKVETSKYDAVIVQLKEIGEITSFNENTIDVTGRYTNLEIELETEKARLERYEKMFDEADIMEDKIILSDRIFDQERSIKYLEESLENIDNRVDYTTITVNIKEKQSEYAYVAFVKFSELVNGLVGSLSSLLSFIFVILPWAIAIYIIAFVVKKVKKKR